MWIAVLKKIGWWVLKMVLGQFADNMYRQMLDEQKRREDALKLQLESLEKGKDLEIAEIKKFQETEQTFKEKAALRPATDPMGIKDWNAGGTK